MAKTVKNKVQKFINERVDDLKKALSYLKNGKGIDLGEDTFLVGKELDGSDKCYGFYKEEGEIFAVTRECSSGFRINEMDYEDFEYMFNGSNVFNKIKEKNYSIVNSEEI
jgi:hypothetical protein